ncbi:GNAT family N-acetyltransferase [Serinibacter arcticus]|nr:GNAT family protein [Serinibacter arcticus]
MSSLAALWPASALRATAGDLELRWIDDDLLVRLADLASRGIHADDAMPFTFPWTRGGPEQVARSVVTYQWGVRGAVGPERLTLELAVLLDGEPVGIQAASGSAYGVRRSVETGSWLGGEHQGRGRGRRMRVLMLHLMFAGLGAREVTSTAFADNPASCAVSERVGYELNGEELTVREGEAAVLRRYRITRERWAASVEEHRRLLGADVERHGVDGVRAQLALGEG